MKEVLLKLNVLFVLFMCVQIGLTSCSTLTIEMPISPIEEQPAPTSVAVVAAQYPPESNFDAFARGYLDGTMKGAGQGMIVGTGYGLGLAAQSADGIGIILAPFLIAGGAVIGATVGTGVGLYKTVPEEQATELDRMLDSAVEELNLSELLAIEVVNASSKFTSYITKIKTDIGPKTYDDSPNYRSLRRDGFGGVIEVRTTKLMFYGKSGKDPKMSFIMAANAHFIDTTTGLEGISRGLVYQSPQHPASIWAKNDTRLLKIEIERAYTTLAERIVENFLLGVDISPSYSDISGNVLCGVVPERPPLESKFYWWKPAGSDREHVTSKVDTLTPLFKWQSFPPPSWKSKPSYILKPAHSLAMSNYLNANVPKNIHITDVFYDLRIWQAVDGAPGELIYERIGLTLTEHRLEIALEPSKEYLWSIRPRFLENGIQRADRWSTFCYPFKIEGDFNEKVFYTRLENGELKRYYIHKNSAESPCSGLDFIPPKNYFRFMTPPAGY